MPHDRWVNAQPWEPPPGMTMRLCAGCGYWFASSGAAQCADCLRQPPPETSLGLPEDFARFLVQCGNCFAKPLPGRLG